MLTSLDMDSNLGYPLQISLSEGIKDFPDEGIGFVLRIVNKWWYQSQWLISGPFSTCIVVCEYFKEGIWPMWFSANLHGLDWRKRSGVKVDIVV